MITSNLKNLVTRLDATCKSAIEGAAGLCLSRTHYEVEIEHLLTKLLEANNTDLHSILRQYEINESRVAGDLNKALNALKTGNTRTPVLSPHLPKLIESAWLLASVDYNASRIRSGHLLIALLSDYELSRLAKDAVRDLDKVNVEELKKHFEELASKSVEAEAAGELESFPAAPGEAPRTGGKTPGLDQYTVNLTQRAQQGKIDPVLGRDREIRQVIDILTRRRQNNPILTGEAGVGKTAVVEGFALRIAARRRAAAAARTSHCTRSTWGCCRPAPASRASSRIG